MNISAAQWASLISQYTFLLIIFCLDGLEIIDQTFYLISYIAGAALCYIVILIRSRMVDKDINRMLDSIDKYIQKGSTMEASPKKVTRLRKIAQKLTDLGIAVQLRNNDTRFTFDCKVHKHEWFDLAAENVIQIERVYDFLVHKIPREDLPLHMNIAEALVAEIAKVPLAYEKPAFTLAGTLAGVMLPPGREEENRVTLGLTQLARDIVSGLLQGLLQEDRSRGVNSLH